MAEKRQVENAKLGLQHNVAACGSAIVGLYKLGFPQIRSISCFSLAFLKSIGWKHNFDTKQTNLEQVNTNGEKNCSSTKRIKVHGIEKFKTTSDGFQADRYFKLLSTALQNREELEYVKKVPGIFGFKVIDGPEKSEGLWIINLKDENMSIRYNAEG
jgi:sterol carrier protein 2